MNIDEQKKDHICVSTKWTMRVIEVLILLGNYICKAGKLNKLYMFIFLLLLLGLGCLRQ